MRCAEGARIWTSRQWKAFSTLRLPRRRSSLNIPKDLHADGNLRVGRLCTWRELALAVILGRLPIAEAFIR